MFVSFDSLNRPDCQRLLIIQTDAFRNQHMNDSVTPSGSGHDDQSSSGAGLCSADSLTRLNLWKTCFYPQTLTGLDPRQYSPHTDIYKVQQGYFSASVRWHHQLAWVQVTPLLLCSATLWNGFISSLIFGLNQTSNCLQDVSDCKQVITVCVYGPVHVPHV